MSNLNYFYSLSGYLTQKGNSLTFFFVLVFFKTRILFSLVTGYFYNSYKRIYVVFNETTCELLLYASENDFLNSKHLVKEIVDISKSVIMPENVQQFQFKILYDLLI